MSNRQTQPMPIEVVRPIRDMILLQPEPMPETQGLIFIPKTAKNQRYRGRVLAVGPGRVTEHGIRVPVEVAPGDRVIYSAHNMAQGIRHAHDENGPVLLPEMDIEAVLEDVVPAAVETKPYGFEPAHPLDALR